MKMKKISYKAFTNKDIGECYHLSKKCLFSSYSIKSGFYTLINATHTGGDLTLLFSRGTQGEDIIINEENARYINIRYMPEHET